MELIVFLLISYGISNIVIFSTIFKGWREFWLKHSPNFFGKLFTCMICLPFWVGILLSYIVFSITESFLGVDNFYINLFLDGCLTSGGVWLIHTIQEKLEK